MVARQSPHTRDLTGVSSTVPDGHADEFRDVHATHTRLVTGGLKRADTCGSSQTNFTPPFRVVAVGFVVGRKDKSNERYGDVSPLDEEAEVAGFADLKGLLPNKHFSSIIKSNFMGPVRSLACSPNVS
jgi:hypothetical protein